MNDWYDFLMEYKWRFLSGGILAVILTIVGVFVFVLYTLLPAF